MKLIKITLIALQVAIFIGLSAIMLWYDAINLITSLIVIFLVGAFGGISYAISGIDKLENELKESHR